MTSIDTAPDAVVIERHLDASVELVWQMWTDPDHFKAWYGPEGASISVARMDVRVGGSRLVCMDVQTPAGPRQMWFAGEYVEVVANSRLVYTESPANENGDILPAAESGHSLTTEVRVELEEADGGTRMVLTHVGIPADSPGATGWAMALDKLAERVGG
jgi:uncharacterized protein YndB with AHSA1/START domain